MKKIIHIIMILAISGSSITTTAKEFEHNVETDPVSTTLKILKIESYIEIIGTDDNTVHLQMEGAKPVPAKAEGLRSLFSSGEDNTGLGVELQAFSDDASVLVLRQVRNKIGKKLTIHLPRSTSIDFNAHMNMGVKMQGLSGEVAAKTLNGAIKLEDVSGPLLLHTVNGRTYVSFTELSQSAPSSITTVNGEIEVYFNPTAKADLDLSVVNGEIFTNLDLEMKEPKDGLEPLIGSRDIKAKLNGGGVHMEVSTVNGEIYLKKAEQPGQ